MTHENRVGYKTVFLNIFNIILLLLTSSTLMGLSALAMDRAEFLQLSNMHYSKSGPMFGSSFFDLFMHKPTAYILIGILILNIAKDFFIRPVGRRLLVNVGVVVIVMLFGQHVAYLSGKPLFNYNKTHIQQKK